MAAPYGLITHYVIVPGFERRKALSDPARRRAIGILGQIGRNRFGTLLDVPGGISSWIYFGSPSILTSRVVKEIGPIWGEFGDPAALEPQPIPPEVPGNVLKALKTFAGRVRLADRDLGTPELRAVLNNTTDKPALALPPGNLGRIIDAMRRYLVVQVTYRKKEDERIVTHLLEPYSFRPGAFYGVDVNDNETRRFLVERILSVRVTGRKYAPRYLVEENSRP